MSAYVWFMCVFHVLSHRITFIKFVIFIYITWTVILRIVFKCILKSEAEYYVKRRQKIYLYLIPRR